MPSATIGDVRRAARGWRGHLPPARRCAPSATGSPPSTAPCCRTRTRAAFDESSRSLATVFPYVENHNFYIEHWYFTVFWNKMRDFGSAARPARLPRRRRTTSSTSVATRCGGALGAPARGGAPAGAARHRALGHWPPIVARRKAIYEAMCRVAGASGARPSCPGRSPSRSRSCSSASRRDASRGVARRPATAARRHADRARRVARGSSRAAARVILGPTSSARSRTGEILVAPSTSPSWTPGVRHDRGGRHSTSAASCATRPSSPASTACRRSSARATATTRSRPATASASTANTGVVTILG